MANQYSLQASRALIQPPYTSRHENLASDYYGRIRLTAFSFVTESAAPVAGGTNSDSTHLPLGATAYDGGYGPVNSGDTILLCKIPKGARILAGFVAFGAFGTSATAQFGTATVDGQGNITVVDAAHYSGAIAVATAGTSVFASTLALNYGEKTTVDQWLLLTAGGANYTNQISMAGHVLWSLD